MIPFRLVFQPGTIFRLYPRREWRRVTIWLKWGLLISFFAVFVRTFLSAEPASVSSAIRALEYLAVEAEMELPGFVKFALFFILQAMYTIFIWVYRGVVLFVSYKISEVSFPEFNVALSIAGASLITSFWYLMPYGYIPAVLHSLFLTAYLLRNINRTGNVAAFLFAFIAALPPLLF